MGTPDGHGRRWLIAGLVFALAAAGGVFAWRTLTDPSGAARAAAERAAAAIVGRTITDGAFGATAGPNEADDLAATLRGMGTLRPVIAVDGLQFNDEQQSRATARLRAEWTIHEGKPAWIQEAYLRLARGPDGWTAVWSRELIASGLNSDDRLRAVRLAPTRGEIIGADGERLVWNQQAKRIGLDKPLLPAGAQPAAARALARAVGIDAEAFAAKVAAYGPRAFVEAVVIRAVGSREWAIQNGVQALPGVRMLDAVRPLALSGRFARQLLGSVGEATGDLIAASGGRVREGDLVGLAGVQKAWDDTLAGVTGFVVQAHPDGQVQQARELFTVPAVDGESLTLTLDVPAQQRAESVLDDLGGAGAVVAVRASDGALLVLASSVGGDAATAQPIAAERFGPLAAVAKRRADGLGAAVDAFALSGDAGLGIPVLLSSEDGAAVTISPFAMAAVAASAAAGATLRPHLFADEWPDEITDGITAAEARTALAGLGKDRRAAAADGTWAVTVRGDLAIAAYHDGGRAGRLLDRSS